MAIESSRCELSFRSLSIVDRAMFITICEGGIVTDCDAKFYESQSGDRCRYVNQFDRIDRIRHTRLRSRSMRNAARGARKVDWERELVVITRRVLYRRAVLMHAVLVYAGPFIANAWRYIGVPLS